MASPSVEDYVRRAEKAEEEIQVLMKELKSLEKCPAAGNPGNNGEESAIPEELEKLQAENKKLKYRLSVLQRATEAEKAAASTKKPKKTDNSTMPSISQLLVDLFRFAIARAYPDLGKDVPCPVTISSTQADYQFNGAMAISGILKVRLVFLSISFKKNARLQW